MAKVTGFGGAFLRADDPKAMNAWYEKHLGMVSKYGSFIFQASGQKAKIAFSFFQRSSDYFPASQPAMLNFQVDHLDELLEKLTSEGVIVDPKREKSEYGSFGWITDLEGNRVELWESPQE